METKLKHFSHEHPLVFTFKQSGGRRSKQTLCSACWGELLFDNPSYSCPECGFYLHKTCSQLSQEINHPLHPNHPLTLGFRKDFTKMCKFCDKTCWMKFLYYCSSCDFTLHTKCALLPQFAAGDFVEVEHINHNHPLINIEIHGNEPNTASCSVCFETLLDSVYFCVDCEFAKFHKKCVDQLVPEILHPFHPKHTLKFGKTSTFSSEFICNFCNETHSNLCYGCSSCNFSIHRECALLPQFLTGASACCPPRTPTLFY